MGHSKVSDSEGPHLTGQHAGCLAESPSRPTAFVSRIDNRVTGTTGEVLAWGACKWGLDADLVAVAAQESDWRGRRANA